MLLSLSHHALPVLFRPSLPSAYGMLPSLSNLPSPITGGGGGGGGKDSCPLQFFLYGNLTVVCFVLLLKRFLCDENFINKSWFFWFGFVWSPSLATGASIATSKFVYEYNFLMRPISSTEFAKSLSGQYRGRPVYYRNS